MADALRPLTGRELNEQHKAMCDAGVNRAFINRWLIREVDRWILALPAHSTDGD